MQKYGQSSDQFKQKCIMKTNLAKISLVINERAE
jgi:hypothetical protein